MLRRVNIRMSVQEVPMRVGESNSNPVDSSELNKAGKTQKAAHAKGERVGEKPARETAGSGEAVKADISAKGREFAAAKAAASGTPDTREAKIAELKSRIAAGSYKPDAHAIADKMVDEHLEMSGIG